MPNTPGTLNGTLIARRTLATLLAEFPLLRMITTDYSPEAAKFGQAIKVQIPTAMAAGDYHTTNGYVASDVSQTEADLTIDKHKHVTYCFNDQERSSTDILLIERFARNAAHALGTALMDDLMALLIVANFANESVNLVAAMDRTKLVRVGRKLNVRHVPSIGRFAVVNSDYYEYLCGDTTIVANAGSPSDTVKSGQLKDVHGFSVVEYADLPANGQNLAGFAGVAEGLILAVRTPTMPDAKNMGGGSVEVVTDPNTGLSIQIRTYYNFQLGKEFRTFTFMYGVGIGNAACVERLVTIANEE